MKNALKYLAVFFLGAILCYFVLQQFRLTKSSESVHVIEYELSKLNKLITAEQNFSEIFSHKSSNYIPGLEQFFSFDKKVVLLVKSRLQASYDLSEMDVEIDSVNQIIKIKKIPEVKLEVFPDVQFYDLDQSTFNTFKKDELNAIKERAVEHLYKKVDEEKIKKEAEEQLFENLKDLYILAKFYNWKVENETAYADKLDAFLH